MNHAPNLRRPTPRPAPRSFASRVFFHGAFALALLCAGGNLAPARADDLKDGKDALAAGRFDDAVAAYRNAVAAAPNDAQAHLGLGNALERKRQWQAALESFQKASSLDARLAEPHRGTGAMLLRLNRPAEAEAAFRQAVAIDRKFPEAQLGLGRALVAQKKIPEALAVYEQGVKFGAKTAPDFYMGLGQAEAARDSVRAAEVWMIKARESATSMAPSVQGAIFRALGDLYMQRKIPSLAISNYQQAKAIDESDLDTRMALGDAYYRGALYNDALNEYKAVVDADPQYAEGYLKLGNLYYLASYSDPPRVLQAIETLEKLLTLEPDNLDGKALLAQALFKTGRAAEKQRAAQLLSEIEATGKFPPEAWRVRGIMQYESGEFANALASFAKAPKLEVIDLKRVADSYRRLAADAADTTRKAALYGAADSVYVSIYDRDSSSAEGKKAMFERGRLRYLMKDYPGAEERLERVIALDPNSGEAYYYLGLSKRARGDDAGGVARMKKALELEPKQAGWWVQLGAAHAKLKETAAAKEAFGKAAALDDSTTVGAIARQQIGFYELLDKNYSEAIRLFEESAKIDAKQFQTWLWLGQAYQNSKNVGKAVEAYRKVQELKPGEPNSSKGLKQLGGL
jgi:tetratricopeptide (TPR) repeat protein